MLAFRALRPRLAPGARTLASASAAASPREDAYLSRIPGEGGFIDRTHPVVYGSPERGPLSAEQLEHFNEKGFLLLPEVFERDETTALLAHTNAIRDKLTNDSAHVVTTDVPSVTEANTNALRSIFEPHKRSPAVARLARDPRIVEPARQILADDVYVHQSRVNYQPGFEGTGFYWHSDFETWHCEDGMPTPRCLSAVVLLTPNYAFNGGLMVCPGSHTRFAACVGETPEANWEQSLQRQEAGSPSHEQITSLVHAHGISYCEGGPGSMLLFDSNLMHGSHSNISPDARTNVFMVFNAVSNALQAPFAAPTARPEHIATRDEAWVKPIEPVTAPTIEEVVAAGELGY